jgi:hypothetical protein
VSIDIIVLTVNDIQIFAIFTCAYTFSTPYKKRNWKALVVFSIIVIIQSFVSIILCTLHHMIWKPERILIRKIISMIVCGITIIII